MQIFEYSNINIINHAENVNRLLGISTHSNLWAHTARFLGCGIKNSPFDHRDFNDVIHAKARYHGINKDNERLPPRQWHESRETSIPSVRKKDGVIRKMVVLGGLHHHYYRAGA